MIACPICTGRHHPQACPTARRFVDECHTGTPDDYREPSRAPGELLELRPFDLDEYRRNREAIKKARWRAQIAARATS